MKALKQILMAACMICCSVLTLKAQDNQVDKINKDREMLKGARHSYGAMETPSGLIYVVCNSGTGAKPKPNSIVRLKYRLLNYDYKVIEDHSINLWEGTCG
jgi:FKBP-type peptidyl-prolyl cis-trans isomerase